MRSAGWICLPPIDTVAGAVHCSADVLDPTTAQKIEAWLSSGLVRIVHFGTPCTSFSKARRLGDGGPGPIRSPDHLLGIPGIPAADLAKVKLGTKLLDITLQWTQLALQAGSQITIENPASSMIWLMPDMVKLILDPHWHVFIPYVLLCSTFCEARFISVLTCVLATTGSNLPRSFCQPLS